VSAALPIEISLQVNKQESVDFQPAFRFQLTSQSTKAMGSASLTHRLLNFSFKNGPRMPN
jgi:hypothetical protein